MARSQRRLRVTESEKLAAAQSAKRAALPEWRWRTFPVFFAFFIGAMVMALLNGTPSTDIAAVAQIIVLIALCYGLARIVVRKVFAERRLTRRERQIARGETPDEDYEDVVVYPGGAKKKR
jgi:hypothetical protein